ncbi:hypothetical protein DFH07DRAFT_1056453 [Mycena maculata]|uniref:Uncharacterized protein n=1 Tax=Mycena maculata TaxID=230809 RepID=A0AAD7NWB6_9AGAR|nr:hypothetical protein DFH07DRAFT_1056453 [Mycena maculata]
MSAPTKGAGIPQGDVIAPSGYVLARGGDFPPPSAVPAVLTVASNGNIVLAPVPALLPLEEPPSVAPLSRTSTVDDDLPFLEADDLLSFDTPDGLPTESEVTAPVTVLPKKGKAKAAPPPPAPSSTPASEAGPSRAPPSYAERQFSGMELSRPIALGTRWSVAVANTIRQDAHSVGAFAANMSQGMREQQLQTEHHFDNLLAQLQSITEIIHDGPRNSDDSLLASLANGHNEAMAAIGQLQSLVTTANSRVRDLEQNNVAITGTLGEIRRSLRVLLAAATPTTPLTAPLMASTPPALKPTTVFVAPTPALVQTPVLAPAPILVPTPVLAPPPLPSLAPAAAGVATAPAAFTAALTAVLGAKHAREETTIDDGRNVRQRSDATVVDAPPAPTLATSTSAPPEAPEAPSRPRGDPSREFLFGPVRWKSNVNSEARTIIAEGMTSRPPMRSFHSRRGPDPLHIICGFHTAGTTVWFIDAWMAERSGKWSAVVARPNA